MHTRRVSFRPIGYNRVSGPHKCQGVSTESAEKIALTFTEDRL